MREAILRSVADSVRAVQSMQSETSLHFIESLSKMIATCYRNRKKLLIAGNGGSLCDAIHFAEEMTAQFRQKRRALAAIALSDPGHMSATGNDMGFDQIFSRAVEALGQEGDLLILLTTSGNSPNLLRAIEMAKSLHLQTAAFLGRGGGKLKGMADLEWIVDGFATSDRIQEAHMAAIHIAIEMVEYLLFPSPLYVAAR